MEVDVQIEGAPEALDRRHGARLPGGDALAAGAAPIERAERADVEGEDLAAERVIPSEHVAQAKRQAQDPLPDRDGGEHVLDEMGGALGHATPAAARADRTRLARERHEPLGVAGVAVEAGEAVRPDAAGEELAELALDERRDAAAGLGRPQERREVRAYDPMQHGVLGSARPIGADAGGGRDRRHPPWWRCTGRYVDPYE